jgi:hypothetical protein
MTLEWTKCCGTPRTSQIPSSGFLQILARYFEDHRAERVAPVSVRNAALAGLKHRVGEFADNVELHLLIGVVADADR